MNPARDNTLRAGRRRLHRARRAFVLLEVIVSLAILGFAVGALMRSFTLSMGQAQRMQIQTQATFLAQQLLDEFEIFTPRQGKTEGGFGDDLAEFSYAVEMKYVFPKYRKVDDSGVDRYFATKRYHLEVYYQKDNRSKRITAVVLDTAVVGFEKFSFQTKQSYAEY